MGGYIFAVQQKYQRTTYELSKMRATLQGQDGQLRELAVDSLEDDEHVVAAKGLMDGNDFLAQFWDQLPKQHNIFSREEYDLDVELRKPPLQMISAIITRPLQPYTLSNFDFVTQSFTLIAGTNNVPFAAISFKRCTPVVVSSLTPFQLSAMAVHFLALILIESLIRVNTHLNSAFVVDSGSGSVPSLANAASYSFPLWISKVASPPSSTMRSGPGYSSQVNACSVHHQYS